MNEYIAHKAAHRDREESAARTLDAGCREAVRLLRAGDPLAHVLARRVLAKAERSASRVLGPA